MIEDLLKLQIIILFNSPYSFYFSPIEEVFGIIKAQCRNNQVNNELEYREKLAEKL